MDIAQKLAELESLHRRAEEGGGPERRKRQHDAAKLTARTTTSLDEGTEEIDKFVEHAVRFGMATQRIPGTES